MDLEGESNDVGVLETPIDPSVQKEYHDLSGLIDIGSADREEILTEADKLFVRETPDEEKKRILILSAHLGTMESTKVLERYLRGSEGSLRDWAERSGSNGCGCRRGYRRRDQALQQDGSGLIC